MATCKSCGAEIVWAKTPAGKSMPLDADPHPDGNVSLTPGGALVLPADLVESGKKIGSKRYRSHFASCPGAAAHRKPKGGA